MTKDQPKIIGIVLIEKFADWEFGLLAAGAAGYFGAKVVFLSPGARSVTSIGGLEAHPSRSILPEDNGDLDAVALIGSDNWTNEIAPDVAPLLRLVHDKGGVIGGICAGTVGLAKGGFLADRTHTSNGREWLRNKAAGYAGAELYQDVPHAVGDRAVVTAPGTAPVSFAAEFLASAFPGQKETAGGVKKMFGAEHS